MANEVEIVVTGRDRGAKRTLAEVGAEGKRVGKDIGDGSSGVAKLRDEFDRTSTSVRKLKEEFARTGDQGLWSQIKDGEGDLKRIRGELTSLKDVGGSLGREVNKALNKIGTDGGREMGQGLRTGMFESIKGLATSPAGIAVGVGLAAAISPVIGAAVGTAVVGGLGGGVIALGISRAVQDQRVAAAWTGMWDDATKALDSRAGAFSKPLIQAANDLGLAFERDVMPKIGNAFDTLAPRVADLGKGAADAISNIFKGANFDRVIGVADRLFARLAAELPNFGNAINDMLGSLADAGPDIEHFWGEFLIGAQRTIVAFGNVVEALAKTYTAMDSFGDSINSGLDTASQAVGDFATNVNDAIGNNVNKTLDEMVAKGPDVVDFLDSMGDSVNSWLDDLFGRETPDDAGPVRSLNKLKEKSDEAGQAVSQLGVDFTAMQSQVSANAATIDTVFGAAVDKVINSMLTMDQAVLGFAESETRMADSVRQNGTELDIHTAKGQANREAILGMVAANVRNFDAMISAGASANEASAAYQANTASLEHQMRVAGFTQQQIDGLIGKYRSVPSDVSTAIQLHGLSEAISGLADVIRHVNGIPTRKDIYITQHLATVGGFSYKSPDRVQELADAQAHGGITGAASGGPRGNWTMVGEQGRELVKLPAGSQVIPNGQTERMMAGADGSSGAVAVELKLTGNTDGAFATMFEKMIRTGQIKIASKAIVDS